LSVNDCNIESKVKHQKGKRNAKKNQGKKTTKKGFIAEAELGIALGPPCLALELKKKDLISSSKMRMRTKTSMPGLAFLSSDRHSMSLRVI
jgi:hypothetical protein